MSPAFRAGRIGLVLQSNMRFTLLLLLVAISEVTLGADNATEGSVAVVVNATDADDGGGEEEVVSFEIIERKMKDAVASGVRRVLPYLLSGGSGAQVSGQCAAGVMKVIGGIRQMREWAFRFLDATGKIPPGILEGTSLSIGDYDECLDIEVAKRDNQPKDPSEILFRGKYCLLEIHRPEGIQRAIDDYNAGNREGAIAKTKTFLNMFVKYRHLSNTTFKIGVCLPSKCSDEDLQNILDSESIRSVVKISVLHCDVKGDQVVSMEQITILCLLGFFTGCSILATIIDIVLRFKMSAEDSRAKHSQKNTLLQIVRVSSLYSNALDVFDTTKCTEPLRSLCAIRPITVILTIYSHTYGHIHDLHFQKFSKPANFLKFFDSFTFSGVANGSVGMDTIIFIAGLTITYSRWRNVPEKGKVKLNLISLLLERYSRMTLAQLLVICIMLLFPLFGSGPIWPDYVGPVLQSCRERWWLHLLYVQNFWRSPQVCLYHTWVFAVVMQLTIVSIVILLVLRRSSFFGILFMIALVLAGIASVAVITIGQELPGSMAFFMLDVRTGPITWREVYTLAYDHVGPFCIGLFTGHFLGARKDKLMLSRPTLALLWCAAVLCNSSVLFGLYSYRNGDKMVPSLSAFYAVMHRSAWAAGIAWLVVASATRHAGAVSRVMHSNFFLPLDRLCYMAFLLHLPLMYFHSGSLRERWYMGHLELMFLAAGYIVMSFLLSFVLQLIFVNPYLYIEKFISSFFSPKVSVTFSRYDRTMNLPTIASSTSQNGIEGDGCVNVAYSKKLDGL